MMLRALSDLWSSVAVPMENHLWQSTLFAVLAAAVAIALRKNQARIRYWIWLMASVKFLLPFSLLVAAGSHFAKPRVSTPVQIAMYSAVEDLSQPFVEQQAPVSYQAIPVPTHISPLHLLPEIMVAVWLAGIVTVVVIWFIGWLRVAFMLRRATPVVAGPEVEALRRIEASLGLSRPIKLVLSPEWMEPGVFGIFRPVLIWPEGISKYLGDRHIDAILAHEVSHVRRRDNLTAVLHMLVEAIFWFHPLVWWMGMKLEEERERACDEQVSLVCQQPKVYAESILRVCHFCSEYPLACVSGITGANLKKRIMLIMSGCTARKLDIGRKLLLLAMGLTMVMVPIALGQAKAGQAGSAAKLLALEALSIGKSRGSAIAPMVTEADDMNATAPLTPPVQLSSSNAEAKAELQTDVQSVGAVAQASENVLRRPASVQTQSTFIVLAGISNGLSGMSDSTRVFHASGSMPAYEEVTIKSPDDSPYTAGFRAGLATAGGGLTVRNYIQAAYGVPMRSTGRVLGGPEWVDKDEYIISGKAPDKIREAMQKMGPAERANDIRTLNQTLLQQRLKLKVHFEMREMPVYELVAASGGLKLKQVSSPQSSVSEALTPQFKWGRPVAPGQWSQGYRNGHLEVSALSTSVPALIRMIANESDLTGQPIVDKTGFAGHFDIAEMAWPLLRAQAGLREPISTDAEVAALSKAMEETLGMKIVTAKELVEVVVIDSIEKPTEN